MLPITTSFCVLELIFCFYYYINFTILKIDYFIKKSTFDIGQVVIFWCVFDVKKANYIYDE